tara:strand:- start:470 stop:964 length:495 start_codon:yes stop_codon:yes gene_type:complete
VVITLKGVRNVEFPVYILPHDDWSFSDGLMFMDGRVVDDRNMKGDTLGVRRLQTSYPAMFPLKRQIDSFNGLLKQNQKTFIDSKGRPFIYEKSTWCTLQYSRIKKKELRDEYCLLWLENTSTPFSVPRPPEANMAFAGVLYLSGLPWILYEYSDSRKKKTRRKV